MGQELVVVLVWWLLLQVLWLWWRVLQVSITADAAVSATAAIAVEVVPRVQHWNPYGLLGVQHPTAAVHLLGSGVHHVVLWVVHAHSLLRRHPVLSDLAVDTFKSTELAMVASSSV